MNLRPAEAPADDERLVSLAKAGDTRSFGILIDRHKERAIRLAFAQVRNYDDAKDVAQEAFVKAYRSLGGFDGKSKFYTWLYRIVVNASIDFLRKRREKTSNDESLFENVADPFTPVPDAGQAADRKAALERALAGLTAQQRTALMLTYFENMSTLETAGVMGISEGTVKATRFQALAKLKKLLGESEGVLK